MNWLKVTSVRTALMLLAAGSLVAQQTVPLTLAQAIEKSLGNYPSIRVTQEQMNAAAAGIRLARTAYLPKIDTLGQVNRATRNNVFGLLLPQSVIPSMSGPVIGTNNSGTVWGSAVGALVTWEPFDFGLRNANVAAAGAARAESEAVVKRTQFDVAVATADAWLTLVAAQETVRAAQAGGDRADNYGSGERSVASRCGPVARGGGTGGGAHATDSGATSRRRGAGDAR